jgi:uridine kinase
MTQRQLFEQLAAYLCNIELSHPMRVAVDGIDAAGKTTLANTLAPVLQQHGRSVIRASIDSFHNPRAIRYARGSSSPEGYYYDSFDYVALKRLLLIPLGPEGSRAYREAVFDHRTDAPVLVPERYAPPDAILLFDGVFLFRPELAAFWDVKMFVDITFEESIARAAQRDLDLFGTAEAVQARYRERYVPGQRLYFGLCDPRAQAHLIINNNDLNEPIITLVRKRA